MRSVNYELTYKKETEVTNTIIKEELINISENKIDKTIELTINKYDDSDCIAGVEYVNIVGDNYDLLMSANPTFAPNKPENEYREEDLWYIIDVIKVCNI